MEVPGGPHYPLLIIKGEHRGYAALTKRFNWFESILFTGIPRLLDSAHKRSLANLKNEWVAILVVGFILSFYRYGHDTPYLSRLGDQKTWKNQLKSSVDVAMSYD